MSLQEQDGLEEVPESAHRQTRDTLDLHTFYACS
jgi:hypothetical protein